MNLLDRTERILAAIEDTPDAVTIRSEMMAAIALDPRAVSDLAEAIVAESDRAADAVLEATPTLLADLTRDDLSIYLIRSAVALLTGGAAVLDLKDRSREN